MFWSTVDCNDRYKTVDMYLYLVFRCTKYLKPLIYPCITRITKINILFRFNLIYFIFFFFLQIPLSKFYIGLRWRGSCHHHYHYHKHQDLDPSIRSVSKITTALSSVSSVFQLFSFLMVCSSMISKGFSFVAFCASVETSSVCIHLSCLVYL